MNNSPERFLTLVKYLIISFVGLGFIACNKDDEDTESPRIVQVSPSDNQSFQTVDTITFIADITDNEGLTYLEISVLNTDFIPVIPKVRLNASGTSVPFAYDFVLDAPLLESGTYVLALTASDGYNTTSSYRQVLLTAIERVIERYYVVTAQGNQTTVHRGLSLNSTSPVLDFQMDLRGAALNYKQNILGLAGGSLGDALFYESEELELVQSYPGFGSDAFPYFLGLNYQMGSEQFILAQNSPRLQILDALGSPLTGVDLLPGYLPVKTWERLGYYFVEEKQVSSPQRFLTRYSAPGLRISSLTVDGSVIELFRKSDNELFVWHDSPSGAKLSVYHLESNLLEPIYQRPGEELKSVMAISTNTFFVGTSLGLYRYNFGNGGTTVLQAGYVANSLYYDDLSGFFFAANGNNIDRLSPMGQLVQTYSFSQPVRFLGFDYNR